MTIRNAFAIVSTILIFLAVGLNLAHATSNDPEFPGRALYPSVAIIDIEEFYTKRNDVIVVDVRSSYEHETLRIKGALNIPLSSPTFMSRVRKLRSSDPRPIIMYCNGKTCMKSYKAAQKCAVNKIDNVLSYDAGIMDWVRKYPNESELLGKSPVDLKKLISKKEFKKHLLTPDDYGSKVANSSAIVLDIRDRFQREGLSLFIGRERRAYLDDKKQLGRYIKKAKRENKMLLVHDAAGKQVRWLQYYIKDQGLKNYYFMKGGVTAYYDEIKKDFMR